MEDIETIPAAEQSNPSLMQKKPEDLTVGDAIKLNLATIAVMAAVPLAYVGGVAGYEKLRTRLQDRKLRKALEESELALVTPTEDK